MSSRTPESTPLLNHRSYLSPYKKTPWYKKKKFYLNLIRRSMAEFLSTGLFVFVAVSSFSNISVEPRSNVLSSSATVVALAHGLAYAALMAGSMHVRYSVLEFIWTLYWLLGAHTLCISSNPQLVTTESWLPNK